MLAFPGDHLSVAEFSISFQQTAKLPRRVQRRRVGSNIDSPREIHDCHDFRWFVMPRFAGL